jgi:diguanylate cyclase (GGDEF)-like protein
VFGKVSIATIFLVIALGGVVWVGLEGTRGAIRGADAIDHSFADRVDTDRVIELVTENSGLVAERLTARKPLQIGKLDDELTSTGAQLAAAVVRATDGGAGAPASEARVVRRIQHAYPAYLQARERLLHQAARPHASSLFSLDVRLDAAAAPLARGLAELADVHFRRANAALAQLRRTGTGPTTLLAFLLSLAFVSLLAGAWLARGVVLRLREAAEFSGRVATGDLSTRLLPGSRDELGTLADSLNEMVEQLTESSSQRVVQRDEEQDYRSLQETFSEILQVTESESEAHDILKLHIERGIASSELVVLNRNNSQDRLEATTDLSADSRLLEPLKSAKPRACLAVRLARPFESGGARRSLLSCEICGRSERESTCLPLLVSGEVIGSILIDHDDPLQDRQERLVHESVAYAAPILANLRNLALAEARAATDALTGLPNRRAIQDTLKRMIAHSVRTLSPLAAIVIDLDHFKQINDTYGHEEGDTVLAAVGDVLSSSLQGDGFAGRNGGEEFIGLLPDADATTALVRAEEIRAAIAMIKIPGVERAITASFGVAIHPEVAGDSETLLRLADRALYVAKAGGRNRVELAESRRGVRADADAAADVAAAIHAV